jgi:hypothetical protein
MLLGERQPNRLTQTAKPFRYVRFLQTGEQRDFLGLVGTPLPFVFFVFVKYNAVLADGADVTLERCLLPAVPLRILARI